MGESTEHADRGKLAEDQSLKNTISSLWAEEGEPVEDTA